MFKAGRFFELICIGCLMRFHIEVITSGQAELWDYSRMTIKIYLN